jgi:hypothetical protein
VFAVAERRAPNVPVLALSLPTVAAPSAPVLVAVQAAKSPLSKPSLNSRPGPAALETVKSTLVEVPTLPAASDATATMVWFPSATVVVSQLALQGAPLVSAATSAPSTCHRTATTPTASLALASRSVLPDTSAPVAGAVMDTTGGVVSGACDTVKDTVADVP